MFDMNDVNEWFKFWTGKTLQEVVEFENLKDCRDFLEPKLTKDVGSIKPIENVKASHQESLSNRYMTSKSNASN